jgi:transposase
MTVKEHSEQAVVATIGVDLGDKQSRVCVLDEDGDIAEEGCVATTASALTRKFKGLERHRIVIETGTHANWVHDLLVSFGHQVVVANARKVRAISANERKCDELDARMLARLGRSDIRLLQPVDVRPAQVRRDMLLIRAREALVKARTELVNSTRGLVKATGERLPSCSAKSFHKVQLGLLEFELRPMMNSLEKINEQITAYDKKIEEVSANRYPQSALVRQVAGVGPITSLYFVQALGDVRRFKDGRAVGAYFGLVPRRDQSGSRDPKLGITKCGDELGRRLLVQCAHYILGPRRPDTDLRRFGLKRAVGAKGAKKRAVVATARKLAVLLFALLRKSEVYEPLRNSPKSPCNAEAVPDRLPSISRPPRTQAS